MTERIPAAADPAPGPLDASPDAGPRDTVRQVVVAVSAVIAVVAAFIGSGAVIGTPIQDAAGGALDADSTLIAPARPAFSIWSVIYVGLLAYAAWQFLPAQRASERQRRVGYPVAASMLLNGAWILSVQAGLLWLSVVIIVALLIVLCDAYLACVRRPPHRIPDAVLTDGVIGLYLGWVCVATAANITAALVDAGFDGWAIPAEVWGVVVIAVATIVVCGLGLVSRGGFAPALSASWGLAWVAVGRLTDEPSSTVVGVAAIIGVAAIVVVTLTARFVAGRDRRLGTPDRGGVRSPGYGADASRSATMES